MTYREKIFIRLSMGKKRVWRVSTSSIISSETGVQCNIGWHIWANWRWSPFSRDQLGPNIAWDWSLGLQLPQQRHPTSSRYIESGEIILVVCRLRIRQLRISLLVFKKFYLSYVTDFANSITQEFRGERTLIPRVTFIRMVCVSLKLLHGNTISSWGWNCG